jgi:hypothetical protein
MSTLTKEELQNRTQRVQDCQTIEELEKLFDEFKVITGSHKDYDAEKLKFKIEQMRFMLNSVEFDKVLWNVITRQHGIRAKCMELFYYEKHNI